MRALSNLGVPMPVNGGRRLFPAGPLIDEAGGVAALALATGATRRTVHRWQHYGLTLGQADTAALCLGLHPSEVWGDTWWTADLDPEPIGAAA